MSGKMKKGDKILIHAGTGGVGQAAINLALYEGCEVFTTVGTPEKRQFILKNFPQIREDHIGNSRDTSFEHMIMAQTDGKGVDIVLNSLTEEKLQASVRCLATGGRFLEIGKFDLAANNKLGLDCFLNEISFHGIMLDSLFNASAERKKYLRDIVTAGLTNGAIKPLARTVFSKDQLETAFRYMAAGKHIGKVIIKVRDEKNPSQIERALPRYHCLKNRSYVIFGGLGGFGMELADWLILRGAKYLVITSRTGPKNGYQKSRLELWKSYGAKVVIITGKDASNREDCQSIFETAIKLAPIDGIFNLMVVLKDALWNNQTAESFEISFRSKAWATKNMDILSRKMCPQLTKFVVFSSVSCGKGNIGQTNYGMSNSVMERICETRVRDGLPAMAVQWGAIGDVGLVADGQEDNKEIVICGTLLQGIHSCLQVLDNFLRQSATIVCSMVIAEKKYGKDGSVSVVERVLEIMGLKDLKTVSPQTTLAELGMDSMMAVEIKQTLEREYEFLLTAQDIRNLNFAKLQEMSTVTTTVNQADELKEILTGMKIFMRILGVESFNYETCIKMETEEIDRKSEVFLIPGVEGTSVFKNIASKLKMPSYVLQLNNKNNDSTSIDSITTYLLPFILDKIKDKKRFSLVGYSFGSLIAIELARKLEAKGMIGKLILIDGAPAMLQSILNQHLSSNNDEELDANILLGIMDIIDSKMVSELVINMANCKTWDKRMQIFITCVKKTPIWTVLNEKQLDLIPEVRKRIIALKNYDISHLARIKSSIVLLKPTIPTLISASHDYNLSEITEGKIDIYNVEGNHRTILDNIKTVMAINDEPVENPEEFKDKLMQGVTSKAASLAQY